MFQGYDLKHFFKFIIPSILAFTILGVYSVVDGFFVGNALGDAGVSAINIVFPAEYYELLEHCLGSLEQVKSKGWSRTEPAPIF